MNRLIIALLLSFLNLLPALAGPAAPSGMFVRQWGEDGLTPSGQSNPSPTSQDASIKPSYCATVAVFTPYATPTDVITIAGSATKTIKINRILLESTQTTAGINQWFLIKRNTADTGGSSTAQTAIALDSTNAAATASVLLYTAAPTINNTVGTVRAPFILSPSTTSLVFDEATLWDYQIGQPVVLRGTAQQLAINFNGAAVPAGLSVGVTIFWTEE